MKPLKYIIGLLALIASCSSTAKCQTLHVITMFDTQDKKIGKSMTMERKIIADEFETIAKYLEEFGYDSQFSHYFGDKCGKRHLMNAVSNLNVQSNDVVLFYYGGHGARAYNNESDEFPQMCLGEPYQSNWVPATLIKNMIAAKNPRLSIILTGCCNKEGQGVTIKSIVAQSQGYTNESRIDKSAFKKLFLDSSGTVQLTSSRAGEYSWCVDNGSFFCLALTNVLDAVGNGALSPDWQTVCQTIKEQVSGLNINTREGYAKQHPHYKINTSNTHNSTTRRDGKTIKRVNDINYGLSDDLLLLTDKSKDIDTRLGLVPAILSKHFSSGGKVMTVGRDMSTIVDYEDAEVFLRRVALSPYISRINVIEQSSDINAIVRVHEIRTR